MSEDGEPPNAGNGDNVADRPSKRRLAPTERRTVERVRAQRPGDAVVRVKRARFEGFSRTSEAHLEARAEIERPRDLAGMLTRWLVGAPIRSLATRPLRWSTSSPIPMHRAPNSNANGAHPFENPNQLTNIVELLAIAVLPAGLTFTFGKMIGRPREGWTLYGIMVCCLLWGSWRCIGPSRPATRCSTRIRIWRGKETRFGIVGSVLTETVTSNAATGSTNSMPDSYTPIGGLVALVNLLLGEIVFGGLGTGLYGLILVVLLALFIAGLMVGRTPEYLGKRIGASEIKLVMLYTVLGPAAILVLAAIAVLVEAGTAALTTNDGPHGFTEILFAYATSLANNGQYFAGVSVNTPFWNATTVVAMLVGRVGLAVLALALAGRFAVQPSRPRSLGTLPTDSVLFGGLAVGTALISAP